MGRLFYRFDHVADDVVAKVLEVISKQRKYYVCFEENSDGENPHYHCYIDASTCVSKWREKMNAVGIKGSNHSTKEWKDNKGGLEYISKGMLQEPPKVVLNNLVDDVEIFKLHEKYWEVNANLKKDTSKRKKIESWSTRVIIEISEDMKKYQWDDRLELTQSICRALARRRGNDACAQRDQTLVAMIDSILIRVLCEREVERQAQDLYQLWKNKM